MKKLFPPMTDEPEKGMPFAALAYWTIAFGILPTFLPMIGDGYWDDWKIISWLEIIFHLINALVVVAMFRSYFAESFLNVQLEPGKFFKTVAVSLLLMLLLALPWHYLRASIAVDAYPVSEMGVAVSSGIMVLSQPIFGTICQTLLTPVVTVGLFYTVAFAPVCCRRNGLGYLTVTLLVMVPAILDILWRWDTEYVMAVFLLQLPIHWIACWSYQKMDSVWAPLASLTCFNLITSLLNIFLW